MMMVTYGGQGVEDKIGGRRSNILQGGPRLYVNFAGGESVKTTSFIMSLTDAFSLICVATFLMLISIFGRSSRFWRNARKKHA